MGEDPENDIMLVKTCYELTNVSYNLYYYKQKQGKIILNFTYFSSQIHRLLIYPIYLLFCGPAGLTTDLTFKPWKKGQEALGGHMLSCVAYLRSR